MSKVITRPIGEIFENCKIKLQVVENEDCEGCFFDGKECWNNYTYNAGDCHAIFRDDQKYVIFKRIDK